MTEDEIKAADLIFKFGSKHNAVREESAKIGLSYDNVIRALKFLEESGFLKIAGGTIQFTGQGIEFQRSKKSYRDYLMEKKNKLDRDDRHKNLQIQDLEIKLKSVEEMQERQKVFWESGIAAQKRQRWQFWLMFFFAAAGFILGIINFIKSIILP